MKRRLPRPTVDALRPIHLARVRGALVADLEARGLLGRAGLREPDRALVAAAAPLLKALRSGTPVPAWLGRRAVEIVLWLRASGRGADAEQVVESILLGRLRVGRWGMRSLVFHHWHDPAFRGRFAAACKGWPERHRRLLRVALSGADPADIDRLPTHLARQATASALRLDRLATGLELPAGLPLHERVLRELLQPAHRRYLLGQRVEVIESCARKWSLRVEAGWLADAVLETLLAAGVDARLLHRPGEAGERLRLLVQSLERSLGPPGGRSGARAEIGPRAERVLAWWRDGLELKRFFERWDVHPDRLAFWTEQLDRIVEVQPFPEAQALAMRIDGVWFVEFGSVGNACYAYPDHHWKQHRPRRAWWPSDLKGLGGLRDRMIHSENWPPRFRAWITSHTGFAAGPEDTASGRPSLRLIGAPPGSLAHLLALVTA